MERFHASVLHVRGGAKLRKARLAGCAVAAVTVCLSLGPVAVQSLSSTASAATANCSATTSGETQLAESGFTASAPTPSTETGAQAPITNVVNGNTAAGRYTSGAPEAVGDDYIVNMGSAKSFNEIEMAVPDYPTDYALGYNVEVSANDSTWTTVASCTGTATPEVVSFSAQSDQYVEVVLTSAESTYWWSMEDFYVFNNPGATTTTTSPPATIGAGDYEIVNENSGMCEEPAGGATANGTAVEQEPCASPATAAQEWEFTSVGSSIYEVLNVNGAAGGEAWNVTGGVGATGSGVGIQIWNYGGGATNEQFKATAVTGGYYTFVAQNSALCVDTPGASVTAGVQLQQYTCNGTGAQEFKLILE